jgi:hypothetical protein
MAPIIKNWCFEADKGTQPDFVLKADKNFSVRDLKDRYVVDPVTNLMNGYSHRIIRIKMDVERGDLLFYLNNLTYKFSNLTSLDLESVFIRDNTLLVLAPKLENLRLADNSMDYDFEYDNDKCIKFDISSVDEDSKCFTKLKTLSLRNIKIDLSKILSKCCNTLESLDLNRYFNLENLAEKLSSLNDLSITSFKKIHENPLKHLLSKVSRSLKTLKLDNQSIIFDLSLLLEETLKITTLEVKSKSVDGLALFLNKCPLVRNLTLNGIFEEVNSIVLKDLRKIIFHHCSPEFLCSALEQASKFSVKSIHLVDLGLYQDLEFQEIPELDTLWIENCWGIGSADVRKLFPHNTKVL